MKVNSHSVKSEQNIEGQEENTTEMTIHLDDEV